MPRQRPARLRVELGTEVLVEHGKAIVMRGRPGARRLLVVADMRMKPGTVAAELRELADRIEVL